MAGRTQVLMQGMERKAPLQVITAAGAITIKEGFVLINAGSGIAVTLAAPLAGIDDGCHLTIRSMTAQAHTVTNTSPGFNNGGASKDVGTFGGAIGDGLSVIASAGVWWTTGLTNVTLA